MAFREPFRLSRRRLLAAGIGMSALALTPKGAGAAARIDPDADWLPSPELLQGLPRQMQALGVPGVGIAVVERGRLAWSRGFGLLQAGQDARVDDATLFEVASMSKPVFAYAVLLLVDRGVLALDSPVVAYHRPAYLAEHPWIDRITVRDVLRHSTGLPNWRKDPEKEKLMPVVEPGTRIDYSGEAFVWLQLAVEAVTGESLDQTMRRLLFAPAGMRDSSYAWDAAMAARSVHGHGVPGENLDGPPPQGLREAWDAALPIAERWRKPLAEWRYADAERAFPMARASAPDVVHAPGDIMANSAASLRCTVRDYARFMALMVQAKPPPWALGAASRDAMLTRQIQVPGRWTDKGLGWNLENTPRGPVFFHSGSNAGIFKAFALGDAARQRAIVVATNAANGNLLYRRIVRASTGLDLLAFDV
jgi:CubicO group peptidase (beta-lactamase class C family)